MTTETKEAAHALLTADDRALIAHLAIEANKHIADYVAEYIAGIRGEQSKINADMLAALEATEIALGDLLAMLDAYRHEGLINPKAGSANMASIQRGRLSLSSTSAAITKARMGTGG